MQRIDCRIAQDDIAILRAADDVAAFVGVGKSEAAGQKRGIGAFQGNGVMLEHRLDAARLPGDGFRRGKAWSIRSFSLRFQLGPFLQVLRIKERRGFHREVQRRLAPR